MWRQQTQYQKTIRLLPTHLFFSQSVTVRCYKLHHRKNYPHTVMFYNVKVPLYDYTCNSDRKFIDSSRHARNSLLSTPHTVRVSSIQCEDVNNSTGQNPLQPWIQKANSSSTEHVHPCLLSNPTVHNNKQVGTFTSYAFKILKLRLRPGFPGGVFRGQSCSSLNASQAPPITSILILPPK